MKSKMCVLVLLSAFALGAQNANTGFFYPAPAPDAKRISGVGITEGVLFTGALIALQSLWYKNYKHSRFHFFNDNAEWMQMDKAGHAMTAYNLGAVGTDFYQWSGMKQRQAYWCGGVTGLLFLTIIEMFDGFSSGWGFSGGDMLANVAGSGLVIGQNLAWNQQRIQIKFSYHQTIYPSYRPDELGTNWAQSIMKDYNGQSYWLSVNVYSFLDPHADFPHWLNATIGMGADGMITGRKTPSLPNDTTGAHAFVRSRKLFLSADVDFTKIQTSDPGAAIFFKTINFIKVPAPALEYNCVPKKLKVHPLYF